MVCLIKEGGGCFWGLRDPPERLAMSCLQPLHSIGITAVILRGNFFIEYPVLHRASRLLCILFLFSPFPSIPIKLPVAQFITPSSSSSKQSMHGLRREGGGGERGGEGGGIDQIKMQAGAQICDRIFGKGTNI